MLQDDTAVLRVSEAVRKWMSNITYRVIGSLQVQVNEATAWIVCTGSAYKDLNS